MPEFFFKTTNHGFDLVKITHLEFPQTHFRGIEIGHGARACFPLSSCCTGARLADVVRYFRRRCPHSDEGRIPTSGESERRNSPTEFEISPKKKSQFLLPYSHVAKE